MECNGRFQNSLSAVITGAPFSLQVPPHTIAMVCNRATHKNLHSLFSCVKYVSSTEVENDAKRCLSQKESPVRYKI